MSDVRNQQQFSTHDSIISSLNSHFGVDVSADTGNLTPDKPPTHLYRSMSEEDWQGSVKRGFIQSDQRLDRESAQEGGYEFPNYGTVASAHAEPGYLPTSGAGRVVQITAHPKENWKGVSDAWSDGMPEYSTHERIPINRAKPSPPIVRNR